jgi:hypothetical protein
MASVRRGTGQINQSYLLPWRRKTHIASLFPIRELKTGESRPVECRLRPHLRTSSVGSMLDGGQEL